MVGPADFTNPDLYRGLLDVSSHELWHAWLVERIRPEALYLPDYSTEQYTSMLWLYEGVTSYYGSLTMLRAGLISEEDFETDLASTIGRFKDDPARALTSVAASSWETWTKSVDAPPYTYYSFYTAGNVLGAVLDMEVRGRTGNRQSLDDVMRYLYQNYAARGIGVPERGLQDALESTTNGSFQPFFDDHVYGTKPIDYNRYFYHVGYTLEVVSDSSRPQVRLGVGLTEVEGGLASITSLDPDGAAFAAGMDIGDVFVAIDGKKVTYARFLESVKDYKPGDTVHVTAFRREELTTYDVTLKGGGNRAYEFKEMPDTSPLQNQTKRDWLGLAGG